MSDPNRKVIYLDDAIDALERKKDKNARGDIGGFYNKIIQKDIDTLTQLSSASEPAIQISWLEKEIERLESYENSFAVLDAVQLKALIKRWESEQK